MRSCGPTRPASSACLPKGRAKRSRSLGPPCRRSTTAWGSRAGTWTEAARWLAHGKGNSRRRRAGSTRLALRQQPVVDDLGPGFHLQVVDPHLVQRKQLAGKLVSLPDRDVVVVAFDQEHHAQMHTTHGGRLLMDQPEQTRLEGPPVNDLLLPLSAHAGGQGVSVGHVFRVDVAAYAERVQVAQPFLGRRLQPLRQEVPISVTEYEIGDDLLVAGVFLDVAPGHEEGTVTEEPLSFVQAVADETVPRTGREDLFASDTQHALSRHRHPPQSCVVSTSASVRSGLSAETSIGGDWPSIIAARLSATAGACITPWPLKPHDAQIPGRSVSPTSG